MTLRDVWRSASVESGGLCVMMGGMKMMQRLSAVSLDYPVKVSMCYIIHLPYPSQLYYSPLPLSVCLLFSHTHAGSYALNRARFGRGIGIIYFDEVECIGNETRLVDCENDGIIIHNCLHKEDASVVCQGTA